MAYEALLVNVHLLGFTGNTDDLGLALELAKNNQYRRENTGICTGIKRCNC